MLKEEYIETLVLNGKMINIGQNDAGQCYFVEWVDENGELKEESCGTYNFHYKEYAEYKFGVPEKDCKYYPNMLGIGSMSNCKNKNSFGYCNCCPYQDIEWSNFQSLIKMGVIDRRGNVNEKYSNYITKKEG